MLKKLIKVYLSTVILLFIVSCSETVDIENTKIDLKYYKPNSKVISDVAMIFVGGSEGGFPKIHNYKVYTDKGIPCLSVAYFNSKNTPDSFNTISLEYFFKTIEYYKSLPEIKNKKIVISGYSKGGELSLLLASKSKDINGVIAINPSHVVFQSPGSLKNNEINSSWSINGIELPFISLDNAIFNESSGKKYRELYEHGLNNANNLENTRIEVEQINGPILLLSGDEDYVWPASYMSEEIINRLENSEFNFKYTHINYKGAGHTLNEFIKMGGSFTGNKNARKESSNEIFEFIASLSE